MVPVDVGKKYRNYFLQDVVMRKMEKVFSKVPQGEGDLAPLPKGTARLLSEVLGNGRCSFPALPGWDLLCIPSLVGLPPPALPSPGFAPPFSASPLNTGLSSPSSARLALSFDLDSLLTWLSPLPIPKAELDPELLTAPCGAGMGPVPELEEIGG